MQVLESRGARFDLALERLHAGHSFSFRGIGFWLAPDSYLEVSIDSSWRIENINEQTALSDLQRAKQLVNDLVAESASFAAIINRYPLRLVLIYDYGTGSVELCRLADGALVWAKGLPSSTVEA